MTDFVLIRQALASLDPASSHEAVRPPEISQIYSPPGHEAALDPERSLVVGGRGMGKSFWAGALSDDDTRAYVGRQYPRLGLDSCTIRLGFAGADTGPGGAPSPDILDEVIERDGHKPELMWRAVILRYAAQAVGIAVPPTWRALAAWAAEDAERLQATLRQADDLLARRTHRLVIVFDALDRVSDHWPEIRRRSQGLLRVALAMRSYRALKVKIFMRVDQAADEDLFGFPDASKLRAAAVDLSWERKDLYGLTYTLLAHDPTAGIEFSRLMQGRLRQLNLSDNGDIPVALKHDEKEQEALFVALAGSYMGKDRRRGRTYTWLHNHLADAHGHVSPRSFLSGLRQAALTLPAPTDKAIDARGLENGVRFASKTRVDQLAEEYRWIEAALAPLAELAVPCDATTFYARWLERDTVRSIRGGSSASNSPVELDEMSADDPRPLLVALRRIGVVEVRPDGRINMPDIFRVAAKLLRRGGLSPRR